jgi:hypothetical protein
MVHGIVPRNCRELGQEYRDPVWYMGSCPEIYQIYIKMSCYQIRDVPDQLKNEVCPDCGKTCCHKLISWLLANPHWLNDIIP